MAKMRTTQEFISKARETHLSRYDYSAVVYDKSTLPVTIKCTVHGAFSQRPTLHLQGSGCPSCGRESTAAGQKRSNNRRRKTTTQFIMSAQEIHNELYNYNMVEYVATNKKVSIVCPLHGVFHQTPAKHLTGNGCPKCVNKQVTTMEFVAKCKMVHGDTYDYSQVVYEPGNHTKVKIICPDHGMFEQRTHNHLSNGQGCPACGAEGAKANIGSYNETNFERFPETKNLPATLYTIRCTSDNEEFIKVGITTMADTRRRYYSIPYDVEVLSEISCTLYEAFVREQEMLQKGESYAPHLQFHGHTECIIGLTETMT